MKQNSIEEVVIEIISGQMGVDAKGITRSTHFVNELGADSLDAVELAMEFEDEFKISIPDEEMEKVATVGDAIDCIDKAIMRVYGSYVFNAAHAQAMGNPSPTKRPTVDVYDTFINGDVTRGILPPMGYCEVMPSACHIAVGCKVYHGVYHPAEQWLEIIERYDLLITGGRFDELVKKAIKELEKRN